MSKKNITQKQKSKSNKGIIIGLLAVLALTTFICYKPALKNQFTNWDDPTYVTENKLIQKLNAANIKKIFSVNNPVSLNYHPITILSLSINHHFSKLKPYSYFLTNNIIHILNVLVVFIFIYLLSNKKWEVAAAAAGLFALHPMHVESVAWISERKDVLYTFFFFASLIYYLRFISTNKTVQLVVCFILFILSCLSKAMAICLPVILILIDYYRGRKIDKKVILEKIPFFLVALIVGINAVIIQSNGAINEFKTFSILQRIMFASYGFNNYLFKLIAPIHLSAFYPYPTTDLNGNIPLLFYISPIITLTITAVPAFLFYKFKREYFSIFIFSILFYFFSVAMVLQFISVGSAIMADRYSYVSYVGPFYFLSYSLYHLLENKKNIAHALVITTSVLLFISCRNRVAVWHDTETLWTDVIEKYPLRVEVAYKNRGNFYAQKGPEYLDKAYNDHIILVNLKSKDPGVYTNLANIYGLKKEFQKALDSYSKALELKKTDNYDIYLNRAITYSMMRQYDRAIEDFSMAEKLNPGDDKLLMNRAFVLLDSKNYEKSIADYSILITRYADNKTYYFNRGLAYFNTSKMPEAIGDFETSIKIDPNYKESYFNLSVIYKQLNQPQQALAYAKKAKDLGYPVSDSYFLQLK